LTIEDKWNINFSYVGFEELNIKEDVLKSNNKEFILTKKTIDLSDVIIKGQKQQNWKLGRNLTAVWLQVMFEHNDKNKDIQEFAKN
jgi:hypothetical protein